VEPSDLHKLHDILRLLKDIKYGRDVDGDSPIDVHLIDRTRFEPVHVPLLPYCHEGESEDKERYIRKLLSLAISGTGFVERLEGELKNMLIREKDRKKKEDEDGGE